MLEVAASWFQLIVAPAATALLPAASDYVPSEADSSPADALWVVHSVVLDGLSPGAS